MSTHDAGARVDAVSGLEIGVTSERDVSMEITAGGRMSSLRCRRAKLPITARAKTRCGSNEFGRTMGLAKRDRPLCPLIVDVVEREGFFVVAS